MSDLNIRGIDAAVGGRTIVAGVEVTAAPGTMTAIVGVNGAGKSTLLRAVAALTRPTAGQVTYGDMDLHRASAKQRAQVLAFVGQEETVLGDLTLTDVVGLGRLPHSRSWGYGTARDKEIIHQSLCEVGLDALADTPCDNLSGGQRRLALIARGLAQETPLLLLDEPTNHLDPHHRLHLLDILRASGRTVIASIHDLDVAFTHFDQVMVLHHGTMHSAGAPQDTLTPEVLRGVFGVVAEVVHGSRPHLIIDSIWKP